VEIFSVTYVLESGAFSKVWHYSGKMKENENSALKKRAMVYVYESWDHFCKLWKGDNVLPFFTILDFPPKFE
jgi:hypothetical protein